MPAENKRRMMAYSFIKNGRQRQPRSEVTTSKRKRQSSSEEEESSALKKKVARNRLTNMSVQLMGAQMKSSKEACAESVGAKVK